ncbi:kinase-like domain-containing protein [Boletus coccyginus]|nr:kinase-like domain-containing protein [Boletus coccyginus]
MFEATFKMVRRELGIWRRLQHNNIVPFLGIAYGFGMRGTMSLVSLWMPNGTLQEFLTKHDSTLDVMHRLQLVYLNLRTSERENYLHPFHLTMKQNNILLDADNTARLADFGYASLVGDIPEALTYLQRSTMQPGAMRWTAPEQVLSETLDRTTKRKSIEHDNWPPFLIPSQVLSGKQPWSEVQRDACIVLLHAQGQKPRRPEAHAIADQHWDLIQQCWSSVQERPPAESIIISIETFLSDLQFQAFLWLVYLTAASYSSLNDVGILIL